MLTVQMLCLSMTWTQMLKSMARHPRKSLLRNQPVAIQEALKGRSPMRMEISLQRGILSCQKKKAHLTVTMLTQWRPQLPTQWPSSESRSHLIYPMIKRINQRAHVADQIIRLSGLNQMIIAKVTLASLVCLTMLWLAHVLQASLANAKTLC